MNPMLWRWGFKAAKEFIKLVSKPKAQLTKANKIALEAWAKKGNTNLSNLARMARKEVSHANKRKLVEGKLKGELTKWK
tara:strand:+ start:2877 stop:3113 length:237 start_codon:yes stop_codon:yes gene_type:complete